MHVYLFVCLFICLLVMVGRTVLVGKDLVSLREVGERFTSFLSTPAMPRLPMPWLSSNYHSSDGFVVLSNLHAMMMLVFIRL